MSARTEILRFIREIKALAEIASDDTPYHIGYVDACIQAEEFILDKMWEDGEDEDSD